MPVDIVADPLDSRLSYGQLFGDLSTFKSLNDEGQAKIRPRVRDQAQTLFSCSTASHAEIVEGILMQRFFGNLRSDIRRRYKRRSFDQASTQSLDNVASRTVLGTPELLEAILSFLPVRTLVIATRVSKTLRRFIYNSPTLLKNLFLLSHKAPRDTVSRFSHDKKRSQERNGKVRDSFNAELYPLLHMDWSSHQTVDKKLESKDHEVVAIDASATYADSFTQMYLTNPPCLEVEIELVYASTEYGERYYYEGRTSRLNTDHAFRAVRTIREDKGVTFAALMEVAYLKGSVERVVTERIEHITDVGTPGEGFETWGSTREEKNSSLHGKVRAWEERHQSVMHLDLEATKIKLHGVIIRTAAGVAASSNEAG